MERVDQRDRILPMRLPVARRLAGRSAAVVDDLVDSRGQAGRCRAPRVHRKYQLLHEHDGLAAPLLPIGQTRPFELERLDGTTVTGDRKALQSPEQEAVPQAAPPFVVAGVSACA